MRVFSKTLLSVTLMGLLAGGSFAAAQDQDQSQPRELSEQRMIIAASDEGDGVAEIQVFSSSGSEGIFVGDGMFPAPDVFSLANNQSVQQEIELVDEQLQQIRKINQEFSEKISEHVRLGDGNMNPDRGRELSLLIKELNEQKKAKMEGVLLPHQFDRLRQIALQTQLQRSGEAATLGSQQVASALGITDEQKQRIEQRASELKKDMDEKIARMKEQARETLLNELTREQREKLKAMMGESFQLKTPDFRDRINRFRKARQQGEGQDDGSGGPHE